MVLGAAEGLDALAVCSSRLMDVLGDRRRPHEGHRLDAGVGQDRVDRVLAAVHDVEDAVRQTGSLIQPGDEVRGRRVALARLQQERVAGRDGDRVHPQRHHGGEVEGRDPGDHPERLAEVVHVHAARDLVGEGALEHLPQAAGELHDLPAAGDLPRASSTVLPCSAEMIRPSSSSCSTRSWRKANITWVRCESEDSDQVSNAAEAACTAVSTSADPPRATRACSAPVAGLKTGAVSVPGTGEPLIQWGMVFTGSGFLTGSGAGSACGRRRWRRRSGWCRGRRPR